MMAEVAFHIKMLLCLCLPNLFNRLLLISIVPCFFRHNTTAHKVILVSFSFAEIIGWSLDGEVELPLLTRIRLLLSVASCTNGAETCMTLTLLGYPRVLLENLAYRLSQSLHIV